MSGYIVPGIKGFVSVDPIIRFERLVDRSGDCHLWIGGKQLNGYGVFGLRGRKLMRAHRAAWLLQYGHIPEGKMILHKCRNRACVNVNHLYPGTNSDNMQDALRDGTHPSFARRRNRAISRQVSEKLEAEPK